MKKNSLLALTLTLGLGAAGSTQALVIDDFNGDTYTGTATAITSVVAAPAGNSSSGYTRTVDITSSGNFTDAAINTATTPGVYAHSQGAGVTGYSQVNFNLGGIDLTEGGTQNAFTVLLDSVDLNGFIGVIVDGVSASLSTTSIIVDNGGVVPSFADFLFSDFAGADLTNVSTVSLFIDGTGQEALDASIDLFSTTCSGLSASGGSGVNGTAGTCTPPPSVPEPGILFLMSGALLGMFGIRKFKA